MTLRRLPALCVALAALIGPAPLVAAQSDLDPATVAATNLTAAQTTQIQEFVGAWLPRLASEDPEQRKRARETLLNHAENSNASVSFRQAYSAALLGGEQGLAALARSSSEPIAINALMVARELATTEAANLLVGHLSDQRVPVRFAAAAGVGRVFTAVQNAAGVPAIPSAAVLSLVRDLGNRVAQEQDVNVLGAAVRSLIAGMNVIRPGFEQVRLESFRTLGRQCAARMAATPEITEPLLRVYLRAATAVRDALLENNPQRLIPRPRSSGSLKSEPYGDAGSIAGQSIALMLKNLRNFPDGDTAPRETGAKLVAVGEAITSLVAAAGGQNWADQKMGEDFAKATRQGDQAFTEKAARALAVLEGLGLGPFLNK